MFIKRSSCSIHGTRASNTFGLMLKTPIIVFMVTLKATWPDFILYIAQAGGQSWDLLVFVNFLSTAALQTTRLLRPRPQHGPNFALLVHVVFGALQVVRSNSFEVHSFSRRVKGFIISFGSSLSRQVPKHPAQNLFESDLLKVIRKVYLKNQNNLKGWLHFIRCTN